MAILERVGGGEEVPLQTVQSWKDSLISTELVLNDEKEKRKKMRKQLGAEERMI